MAWTRPPRGAPARPGRHAPVRRLRRCDGVLRAPAAVAQRTSRARLGLSGSSL